MYCTPLRGVRKETALEGETRERDRERVRDCAAGPEPFMSIRANVQIGRFFGGPGGGTFLNSLQQRWGGGSDPPGGEGGG